MPDVAETTRPTLVPPAPLSDQIDEQNREQVRRVEQPNRRDDINQIDALNADYGRTGNVPREPITKDGPAIDEASLRERHNRLTQREAQLDAAYQAREITPLTDKSVESQIVAEFAVNAFHAFSDQPNITLEAERALKCTTLYMMILRNGMPIFGTAVCAAPENFDLNDGRKEAKAEAMAELWQCEEYALRNRIMGIDPSATSTAPVKRTQAPDLVEDTTPRSIREREGRARLARLS